MTLKAIFWAGVLMTCTAALSSAAPLTWTGNFSADDDVITIPFSVSASSVITIQTTSFANGSKGFEPVLALFDGGGNLLMTDSGGTAPAGCGVRAIESASGFCLDAYIQATLNTGNYIIALVQWDNLPNGPMLSDGFPQTGNGNFTGPNFTGAPGSFVLFDGSQRNSNWALQVDGLDGGSQVPEPATFAVTAGSLLFLWARRKIVVRTRAS